MLDYNASWQWLLKLHVSESKSCGRKHHKRTNRL